MTPRYTQIVLEAGNMIQQAKNRNKIPEIIVECTNSALQPDLCCLYLYSKGSKSFKLSIKKGYTEVPESLPADSEFIQFLNESQELVCLNTRKLSPFQDILLADRMESGLAVSFLQKISAKWILIVNSTKPFYFKHNELLFLENIRSLS